MRISDWSSDVCSSELENYDAVEAKDMIIDVVPVHISRERMDAANDVILDEFATSPFPDMPKPPELSTLALSKLLRYQKMMESFFNAVRAELLNRAVSKEEELLWWKVVERSEEHTSELQSLMRISYAVFCL